LVRYAINIGVRQDDPTTGVRVKMPKTDGFKTWTEEDIAVFEAAYPIGTKERLALVLLLNTALRCADVVRVGRQHVRGDTICNIKQQKTGMLLPPIPITAELAAAINAAAPGEHLVFLVNERGKAFNAKRFGEWFSKQCRRAGLMGLSAHGLRTAACRRLAENGAPAPTRSPPSAATLACGKSSAIPRRPIRRDWRVTPWPGPERQHRVSNPVAGSV
jgi:integrase